MNLTLALLTMVDVLVTSVACDYVDLDPFSTR